MELKIYYYGRLDTKRELRKQIKKALWATYVYLECVQLNKRWIFTAEEKEAMKDLSLKYAAGTHRPKY